MYKKINSGKLSNMPDEKQNAVKPFLREERSETLDVIVRLHNPKRLFEFGRCLLSLLCQSYTPIHIIIVTQRFTKRELNNLRNKIEAYDGIQPNVTISSVNFQAKTPVDARAALLNMGVDHATGRYIAFLDYDDVTHYKGYTDLIGALKSGDATIAFGGIAAKYAVMGDNYLLVRQRHKLFDAGSALLEHFKSNHCPINSLVLDRTRIKKEHLRFDESLCRNEDYEFLLRTCAQYVSDFSMKAVVVADYYIKDDESNTILSAPLNDEREERLWRIAEQFIERRKNEITVSAEVQKRLGRTYLDETLTIQQALRARRRLPNTVTPKVSTSVEK